MAADVESDIIDVIVAATSWVEGTNLFRGPVRAPSNVNGAFPVPVKSVFVRFVSGTKPLIHRGSSVEEKEWTVDIIIRGDRGEYGSTRTEAAAILAAVHDSPPSGYIDAMVPTSHPTWIGEDDAGSHYFVVSVRLRKLEA